MPDLSCLVLSFMCVPILVTQGPALYKCLFALIPSFWHYTWFLQQQKIYKAMSVLLEKFSMSEKIFFKTFYT